MLRGLLASGALELRGVWTRFDSLHLPSMKAHVTLEPNGHINITDKGHHFYEILALSAAQGAGRLRYAREWLGLDTADADPDDDPDSGEWVVYEAERTGEVIHWPEEDDSLIEVLRRVGALGRNEQVTMGEYDREYDVMSEHTGEPLMRLSPIHLRRRLTAKDAADLMTKKQPSLHMEPPLWSKGRMKALDSLKLKLTKQDRADLMVWLDSALERGILS